MNKKITVVSILVLSMIAVTLSIFRYQPTKPVSTLIEIEEEEDKRGEHTLLRWLHEFNMIKDPVLNQLPKNVTTKEFKKKES